MHVQSPEGAMFKDLRPSVSKIWEIDKWQKSVGIFLPNPNFVMGEKISSRFIELLNLPVCSLTIKVTKVNISCTCWSSYWCNKNNNKM